MTTPPQAKKPSRTAVLLESLNIDPETFKDPELPSQYFSHSQYNAYKICGQAYAYRYVDKLSSPGSGSMTKGSAVHKGVEVALLGKMAKAIPSLKEILAITSDTFDEIAEGEIDWGEDIPGIVKDQALKMVEHYAIHALHKMNPVAVEKGFAFKFGGIPTIGFIDLLDERPIIEVPGLKVDADATAPTKLVVVDLKTSKTKWSETDLAKDTQMTLYTVAEGTPAVRVDQLLQRAKGPEYVAGHSIRSRQDGLILEEDFVDTVNLIKSGIFPKAEISSWKCNAKFCPYWSQCRGRKR